MSSTVKVPICNIIEGFHCVDAEDGEKIYAILETALANGDHVELSFANLQLILTVFLNTALGKLCSKYSLDKVRNSISFTDTTESDRALIERVLDNAVKFYANTKNA